MKVKVFESNKNGKVEFTRAELEKLLNEVYMDGYGEGEANANSKTWTWTEPYCSNGTSDNTITTTNAPCATTNTKPSPVIDNFINKLAKELNF